ncbi:kinase-like domain-containing protein [Aspergillus ambiguus]|uniref:serine/threonine-protein kinase n=1 Tax=Aspergillus ambiguus TaxID=176160 RepID=UPI003CCCC1AE
MSDSEDEATVIGTLTVLDLPNTEKAISTLVYEGRSTFVGRDPESNDLVLDDPRISNKHLRVYTVLFDADDPRCIPVVGHGACILRDGDILTLVSTRIRYDAACKPSKFQFDEVRRNEIKMIEAEYKVTDCLLGEGGSGKVYMAYNKATGQQFACKITSLQPTKSKTAKLQPSASDMVVAAQGSAANKIQAEFARYDREANILKRLSQANIIRVERVFKSSNTIYLIQELASAGDLYSFLQSHPNGIGYTNSMLVILQVTKALDYLHDHNIVHRDLKPDNILLTGNGTAPRAVLTDFGAANMREPVEGRFFTMVGSFGYTAPEILPNHILGYTKAVDMWSLGLVACVVLTDYMPEDPYSVNYTELEEVFHKYCGRHRAADFVFKLLMPDEDSRMTAKEALRHAWFANKIDGLSIRQVYKKIIQDWRPVAHKEPFIVDLDGLGAGNQRDDATHGAGESQPSSGAPSSNAGLLDSQYFISPSQAASSTLSDPQLPALNRAVSDEPNTSQDRFDHDKLHPEDLSSTGSPLWMGADPEDLSAGQVPNTSPAIYFTFDGLPPPMKVDYNTL